jgi:hypothetical protein
MKIIDHIKQWTMDSQKKKTEPQVDLVEKVITTKAK